MNTLRSAAYNLLRAPALAVASLGLVACGVNTAPRVGTVPHSAASPSESPAAGGPGSAVENCDNLKVKVIPLQRFMIDLQDRPNLVVDAVDRERVLQKVEAAYLDASNQGENPAIMFAGVEPLDVWNDNYADDPAYAAAEAAHDEVAAYLSNHGVEIYGGYTQVPLPLPDNRPSPSAPDEWNAGVTDQSGYVSVLLTRSACGEVPPDPR